MLCKKLPIFEKGLMFLEFFLTKRDFFPTLHGDMAATKKIT